VTKGFDDKHESEGDLLDVATHMGLQWGHADLLAVGPGASFERLGELAAYFVGRADGQGRPKAHAVWLVLPPRSDGDLDGLPAALRRSFADAAKRVSDVELSEAELARASEAVTTMYATSFDADALLDLVASAPEKTGIIVAEARHYRCFRTELPSGPLMEEDVWTAHVHRLVLEITALCREGRKYVLLDLGWYQPSRQENCDLLGSVEGMSLAGLPHPGPGAAEVQERVSRWYEAAHAGEIGSVIREVEEDSSLSDRQKYFFKLEVFSLGKLHDQVRELLRGDAQILADLPANQAVHVARIAEAADLDDLAETLIRAALPSIQGERDLETALTTALTTGRLELISIVSAVLSTLFPGSKLLNRHLGLQAAQEGRYAAASETLARSASPEDVDRASFFRLLAQATSTKGWKPAAVRDLVINAMPAMETDVVVEIPRALEREGRRLEAIAFLDKRGDPLTSDELRGLIGLTGRALQAGELSATDPKIEQLIDVSLAYLAEHPGDGHARTRLASLMGPNMTASAGLAMLVAAVMRRADRPLRIRPRPRMADRSPPIDPAALYPCLQRVWDWLQNRGGGTILVGRHPLPANELGLPADQVMSTLVLATEYTGSQLTDEGDHRLLIMYVAAAVAIAPLSPESDEDLTVLRTAGTKLAVFGRGQAARDLAENAVLLAGDRPERRRRALFTFADIYARLGMKTEALVALGAAFDASPTVTWDEVWFETNLIFRLLRDVGMVEQGLPLLSRSKRALEEIGLAERDGYRLDTLALQAETASFDRTRGNRVKLVELLRAAWENAEQVIRRQDDPLPIAMVLNSLLYFAQKLGVEEVGEAEEMLVRLSEGLPAAQRTLVRASGPVPTLSDIAAVAGSIDAARYADDVGYDLRTIRVMARRLVTQALGNVDPETLIYAIEASADHAILIRNADGTRVSGQSLLVRGDAPAEAAQALSRHGAAVVGLALFGNRLATVEFENGVASDFTLEAEETFSAEALERWSTKFPYDYRLEDKCLSREAVRQSVDRLGLTKLPERSVLIADPHLQRLPPNLMLVDGNFAGFTHAIAVAPSLEWLVASRTLDRSGNGTERMWIPLTPQDDDKAPLTLMRNDVESLLQKEGVPLEVGAHASAELASADVAIIGSHGGLTEVHRYFRAVTNDADALTDIPTMIEVTRRARLTILFVCSGGRIDPHPETGMALGLAKQILGRGCSAVIAPAWPVPFFIARPWLEGFLREWRKGTVLLDAFHAANLAVAKSSSWDPKRTLAMSLYGDPFLKVDRGNLTRTSERTDRGLTHGSSPG
jgi:tetratricopeptide (TPR) repeat protein